MAKAVPAAVEKTTGVFSATVRDAGTWIVGASLTGLTLMLIDLLADLAPPAPELPRSSTATVSFALPSKSFVGVKTRPLSASLTRSSVVVKVIVASSTPSPAPNDSRRGSK